MATLTDFLLAVQWNKSRVREYVWGGDGTNGECDCIGLIIGGLRRLNISWPWTHGTNYTVRNRMRTLRKVGNAKELALGELVFKAHEPDADDWALPSTYKGHPDQRDYYHVGVVTGISPLQITHCTSANGGIKVDTALGRWGYAGELDLVDYGSSELTPSLQGEGNTSSTASGPPSPQGEGNIYAVVGGRLALRSTPRKADNNFLKWLPDGAQVTALKEAENGWIRVEHEGMAGYCVVQYLEEINPGNEGNAASGSPSPQGEGIIIPRAAAEMIYRALGEALGGQG
ncbi:MAG: SH3 domain-containing protein [Clostridiales bacterium]|nr:SH3 domain-containing protein [Clostridiales bacterium]